MATGHHAGGVVKALELIRARNGGTAVPFFMHPGMFRRRALQLPTGDILPFNDVPTAAELTEKGAAVKSTDQPALALEDMFYLSGEIPRVTQYEHGLPNQVRRTEDGSGWEPDPLIMDERFLTVHIRDKGLLIFSACSHAGLINVLTGARRLFPKIPLYGVMGGFHLSGSGPEKIIPETLRELADFDVRWIIPCRCTGWRAVMAFVQAFGEERVVPGAVGQRFAF